MDSFEEWYENYERDGGELMLYNTIDLEAAYRAGMLRAAEIASIPNPKHSGFDSVAGEFFEDGKYAAGQEISAAIRKEAESD